MSLAKPFLCVIFSGNSKRAKLYLKAARNDTYAIHIVISVFLKSQSNKIRAQGMGYGPTSSST